MRRTPPHPSDRSVRRLSRGWHPVAAAALLTAVAACASGTPVVTDRGAGSSSAQQPADTSAPPDRSTPIGVVALGHSGLTGFRSDPANPEDNAFANSWATGSNPAVDSIYVRLAQVVPGTTGHVANLARNGAQADSLPFQVQDALREVPAPRLALIQVMDNDIRCDGTDPAHLPEFRASIREAVEALVAASPGVTVVLVGGPGRPATYAAAVAALPTTPTDLVGSGPCALFSANKVVNRAEVARLTGLMEQYEAEFAKACQGIPQCHTDAGAASRVPDAIDGFGSDLGHLSVLGHARTAAAVWPVVASALGLPAR